jgi:hypothetical protein
MSLWAGRILSALPVLLFAFTGMFGLLKPDAAMQGAIHYGYAPGTMVRITIVEIACAIVYAIPRTSVLGAILMTGYLGGATATHVRVGEPSSCQLSSASWFGQDYSCTMGGCERSSRFESLSALKSV